MKHITLDEWDRNYAPYLNAICIRAAHVVIDSNQIRDWVENLGAVPDFETEAISRLKMAKRELGTALEAIDKAIDSYNSKDKVT